jgi:ferritin-like metal-binding protein YciE
MELQSLRELFLTELQELYFAEKQITAALPRMAKAASSRALRKAFKSHLNETEGHVERLEKIFDELGVSASAGDSEGIEGLIRDTERLISEDAEPEVLDAGLIAAAQKVEHYEMAAYGTVRTYAELLGRKDIAKLLQRTLDEEKQADRKLNAIAEEINVEARSSPLDDASGSRRYSRSQKHSDIGGFVSGLGLGMALGVLFAPVSGRELRQRASDAADQVRDKVADFKTA